MRASSARLTALRVLMSCRTNGAWADAALKAQLARDGLTGADAALCSRIVYGVLQNRMLLDHYIGAYCSQKPDHLQPPLLDILRIGAYQILFLDKVPDSAAVNEAVELAKIMKRGQASGLVNAVLRKISKNKDALPAIPDRDVERYLSIRYSHPKWLVKRLLALLGREETEAFLAADNGVAPLTIQVDPMVTTAEALCEELRAAGIFRRSPPLGARMLGAVRHGKYLTSLPAFQRGAFSCRIPAARLVSLFAEIARDSECWTCAPPRAGNPSVLLLPWRIRARSSPAIFTKISSSASRTALPGWALPVSGRWPRTGGYSIRNGRMPLTLW